MRDTNRYVKNYNAIFQKSILVGNDRTKNITLHVAAQRIHLKSAKEEPKDQTAAGTER